MMAEITKKNINGLNWEDEMELHQWSTQTMVTELVITFIASHSDI
jgi:hypothetical protein